ncbi:hypothetical protein IT411_01070 [Candidatus Peregrinibacteria bacterium]|nr:hypothetical protein [Candidatus Peregrinibacteria bacterium]
MTEAEKMREMLRKMTFCKAFQGLTLEEIAILKAAVIRRDVSMTDFVEKVIDADKKGLETELLMIKGVIDDYTGKNEGGHLRELREAAAKREEENYLENLLKEVEG